jgi:hypothetical protein
MPATSAKQKKFMDAAANNPAFAKKVGIPSKVAKEYSQASKGQTFKQGGEMKESKAMMKKEVDFMKKKGAPKSMIKHEMAESKMSRGGMMPRPRQPGVMPKPAMPPGGMMPRPRQPGVTPKPAPFRMAAGGSASKRADGIAKKGKTKGKMLARGGKTC